MNTVLEKIHLNETLLNQFSIAEVYSSINENFISEFTSRGHKTLQSFVVGTGLRTYNYQLKTGQLYVVHGISNTNKWIERAQANNIPYCEIPCKPTEDSKMLLPIINYEMDNCVSELFNKYKPLFAEKNLRLEKLMLERYILAYKLANTYGVTGNGYKLLCSPSVFVTDERGIELQYSKIYDRNLLLP